MLVTGLENPISSPLNVVVVVPPWQQTHSPSAGESGPRDALYAIGEVRSFTERETLTCHGPLWYSIIIVLTETSTPLLPLGRS